MTRLATAAPAARQMWKSFALAGSVFAMDMVTKSTVVAIVEYGESHVWLPVLNIVHVMNRGAAFSFLHNAGGWQRPFFVLIALAASALLVVLMRREATSPVERLAFGLILGGALANMTDRLVRGAVVDWIDLHWGPHHWPAFNVADMGIMLGAAAIIVNEIRRKKSAVSLDRTR
ncbi:MAG: signal peptidase II [Rubrivivax sp.]